MQLAFYKGPPSDSGHRFSHQLICWFTGSPYSHVELVIDGTCWSASARDGGVRSKQIDLASGRWDVFDVDGDEAAALRWFESHTGQRYDYAGVARFVLPFLPQRSGEWFCSEAVAAALGLPDPSRFAPGDMVSMVESRLAA